jgi:hypothetical protein
MDRRPLTLVRQLSRGFRRSCGWLSARNTRRQKKWSEVTQANRAENFHGSDGRIQCAGRESSILQKIVPRFDSKTSGLY